jgi:hypothetical protein
MCVQHLLSFLENSKSSPTVSLEMIVNNITLTFDSLTFWPEILDGIRGVH